VKTTERHLALVPDSPSLSDEFVYAFLLQVDPWPSAEQDAKVAVVERQLSRVSHVRLMSESTAQR
jgi:hypothetical protein